MHNGRNDPLPLGAPMLQWSCNRDGEAAPGLVESRDERMGLEFTAAREQRRDLASLAGPQGGVEAMAGMFPDAKPLMAGVRDNGDASTKPVLTFAMKGAKGHATGR